MCVRMGFGFQLIVECGLWMYQEEKIQGVQMLDKYIADIKSTRGSE